MNHDNMKMTEIGWIPKDWECKRLDGCSLIKARIGWQGLTKSEYLPYGTYYLVGGTDFENGRVNWNTCSFVTKERFEQDKYIQIRNHDVLISKDGTIGKVAYVNGFYGQGTLNSGVFVVRPKSKDIDQGYFAWTFLSMYFDDFISRLTAGSTIKHVYQKDLVNFLFPLPTKLSEQRRIAEVLSDTDSLIASLSHTIEKKRLVKQGAMQQLLTGKTRLKGFSGEWVEKELGECADIYRGGSPRPIESFITTLPDGLNWIKIGDVANNAKYINKTAERIIPEGEKHSRFVRNGDLLLSNSMSFGRPYILRTDGCIHDGWLVIQNYKDEWVTDFLYYLLCSENVLKQYEVLAAGSGVKNLNKAIVSNVVLRYPVDLNEQFAIANILTTMDNEITSLEAELQKYKALKQGMMQKLLTGEIRLPICQTTE